jgi:hypothetical protein
MLAALAFQPVDRVPLQIHPSPAGLYEHGQKLLDLMRACGHDFDDQSGLALPIIPNEDFDTDGRYHKFATDAWGTFWEYRLFGVWGYRIHYPLADISRLGSYRFPEIKPLQGQELAQVQAAGIVHRRRYFHVGGGVSLFETMQSLRPFADVLIDIAQDTPEINRLADLLVEYNRVIIENALAAGVDAVSVGDDFGTQQALMLSPKTWRRFFLPRYLAMFEPVKRAGKRILFHSCGMISSILPDLREAGADAIWPQLSLFNHRDLAKRRCAHMYCAWSTSSIAFPAAPGCTWKSILAFPGQTCRRFSKPLCNYANNGKNRQAIHICSYSYLLNREYRQFAAFLYRKI